MASTFLLFLVLALLIFFSGKRLSFYGDVIAEHLGLGKAWIGLVLMASVTSLPELTVGISSVTITQSADLALGNVLGSCVFNLLMISLVDVLIPETPVFSKASASHALAGSMSIILFSTVGLGIFLPQNVVISKWIGLSSLAFVVVYFASMRIIYFYEQKLLQRSATVMQSTTALPVVPLNRAVLFYVFHACVVIGAALFLPGLAATIAAVTGLGESFVGTLFLAASTVLPEFAVTLGALRIGALDLAIGNLIGSNLFNILILAIDDAFYTKGYLLKDASDSNLVSVFSVIIMTAIAVAGLTFRVEKKRFRMSLDTLSIAVVYLLNLLLLYYLRGL